MAYQQHLPYDTSSRQHYDHRIASNNGPPPHSQGQRVSNPSEGRFDPTRGYQYENGAHDTHKYGEYNDRFQGYALTNSPRRQELGQPTSHRPAQGEAQVTHGRRQHGPERADGSKLEAWGQGRGRARGEGARPGSDIRPLMSQNNEPAIHVQMQPKPRMSV